jgi:hypothetical protein
MRMARPQSWVRRKVDSVVYFLLSHSIVKVIYKVKLPNGHRRFALVQASSALG